MQVNAFLKLGDIKGESQVEGHEDWIGVISYTHGLQMPVSARASTHGRTAGDVVIQDFVISKVIDRATPALALACCQATMFPEATLELYANSTEKVAYMSYKLYDVVLTSVQPAGSGLADGSMPVETLSLNFNKIEWAYTPRGKVDSPEGAERTGWDRNSRKKM